APGELRMPVLGALGVGAGALERELLVPREGAQSREPFLEFGTDAQHVREIAGQLPLAAGQRPLEPADLLDQPPVVESDQVQVLVPVQEVGEAFRAEEDADGVERSRSEERRVGKEGRSRWTPCEQAER